VKRRSRFSALVALLSQADVCNSSLTTRHRLPGSLAQSCNLVRKKWSRRDSLISWLAKRHALLYRRRLTMFLSSCCSRRSSRRWSRLAVAASRDNHRDEVDVELLRGAERTVEQRRDNIPQLVGKSVGGVGWRGEQRRSTHGWIELGDVDRSDVSRRITRFYLHWRRAMTSRWSDTTPASVTRTSQNADGRLETRTSRRLSFRVGVQTSSDRLIESNTVDRCSPMWELSVPGQFRSPQMMTW